MSSQPSTSATHLEVQEKFSIIDPAMLVRMRERALRWRMAQKRLARVMLREAHLRALAGIAATVDLGSGDAIAAQRYAAEVEIARGAGMGRIAAAIPKKSHRSQLAISAANTLSLAVGIAGGMPRRKLHGQDGASGRPACENHPSASLRTGSGVAPGGTSNIVVALLEMHFGDDCAAILRLAVTHKLPLVIVALGGALPHPLPDNFSAYEIEGFPRIPVDRSDPIAVYRVAHEGIERARIGYGPTLVDCLEWRFDHECDPLTKLEDYMTRNGEKLSARSSLQRRLLAERKVADASEPEILLFAPAD